MADVGYIRVSTVDQNTNRQLDGVAVDKTFEDKASGGSRKRPALENMMEYVRDGDTVHILLARTAPQLERAARPGRRATDSERRERLRGRES